MQTFTKTERLSSKLLIDKLVEKGRSFNNSPFKFVWIELEESATPVQFLISVPKRNFKKAVDRNKLKRRSREAYRKNKADLLIRQLGGKKICLMLVYIAKEKLEYVEIEQKIKEGLQRLVKTINS
ncbi:MAG: ribonuclease P protein component [Bacteroidetes bacterium]|nr:ribonuclease P protein component [Bacteroidota bacterium]